MTHKREKNTVKTKPKMTQGAEVIENNNNSFLGGTVVKNLPARAGNQRCSFDPWIRKIPWRRK